MHIARDGRRRKKSWRRGRWGARAFGEGLLGRSTRSAPLRQPFFRRDEPRLGSSRATPESEIEALKAKARAIETRLGSLNKRIREFEQGSTPQRFIAVVDSAKCAGCGTCQDVCPTRAVAIEEIAEIDPKRCIGCGLCVQECPQSALLLRPVDTDFSEQSKVAW